MARMSASQTQAARIRTGSGYASSRTTTPAPIAGDGGDLVGQGAAVPGAVAEHHVHLLGLIEPHGDPGGEQVPEGDHVLARVLQRGDHAVADRPALGGQGRQRGLGPFAQVAVGLVGGQERELVDQHHDERELG